MQAPLTALRGLFNIAGGLPYHALAYRYRQRLWSDYASQVERALLDWAPQGPELVIVGPSAGWLLPHSLLQRFERVVAIEPDPLARWLLRQRFSNIQWDFDVHDYFSPYGPEPWRAGLQRLAERYPDQPIYFAEFLGQFIGLYPDAIARETAGEVVETPAYAAWKREFRDTFGHRQVFSSHDRLVARQPPLCGALKLANELCADELAAQLWPPQVEVLNPLTDSLFYSGTRRIAVWQRQPGFWHAMELVHSPVQSVDDVAFRA
jgi:hypothetical protein